MEYTIKIKQTNGKVEKQTVNENEVSDIVKKQLEHCTCCIRIKPSQKKSFTKEDFNDD